MVMGDKDISHFSHDQKGWKFVGSNPSTNTQRQILSIKINPNEASKGFRLETSLHFGQLDMVEKQ